MKYPSDLGGADSLTGGGHRLEPLQPWSRSLKSQPIMALMKCALVSSFARLLLAR